MSTVSRQLLRQLATRFGLIGESPLMVQALSRLLQVAPTDLSVLITGETGTGKEVFANAVHELSGRKRYPFVSVNCGAIPETLLESELFGAEKGAFTGSVEQRKGFFESAHRGTIFLDEIGEMPVGTQVKRHHLPRRDWRDARWYTGEVAAHSRIGRVFTTRFIGRAQG